MPIKDPEKKREYEKAWRRRERAQRRLGELVKPQRKPVTGVSVPASDSPAELEAWIDQKAQIARELIEKGRGVILSPELTLNAKDALELIKEGGRLMDALAAQTVQEQQSVPIDVSGLLSNQAALTAAMELLSYAARPNGPGSVFEPGAGPAVDEDSAEDDPGSLCGVREPGSLEGAQAPPPPPGRPAARRKGRNKAPPD